MTITAVIADAEYRFEKDFDWSACNTPNYRFVEKAKQRGLIAWCDRYWHRGVQKKF